MPAHQRVSIEQIVEAYKETGSVWKAGKRLGIVGQSVWERLKSIGHEMPSRTWSEEELAELEALAVHCPISEIARRLARPYYAIAIKMSRMGLTKKYGNRQAKQIPRGSGFNKVNVQAFIKEVQMHEGSLRQFVRMKGFDLETFVQAIQKYDMDFWNAYVKAHSDLELKQCAYCTNTFYPMTGKQKTCSRKCSADAKRDEQYFGGNRRSTIGLAEGVCQLCLQPKERGLSSHHVLGKENDPENKCLVALCRGCHQLVGKLAARKFVDMSEGWENLITLVMGRRMADKNMGYAGAFACVELEYLKPEDIDDMGVPDMAVRPTNKSTARSSASR